MRIQISSGRGPVECELAVGLYLARLLKEHPGAVLVNEQRGKPVQAGGRSYAAYKSAIVEVTGDFPIAEGSVQWICQSPARPNHKRKNWFIEVTRLPDGASHPRLDEQGLDPDGPDKRLIRVETFRCPGKGGQNVNKVETGVRVTHVPTGFTAHSVTARTQGANKKLALTRLRSLIREYNARRDSGLAETAWRNHDQLERGNAVCVFEGPDFVPV